MSRIETETMLRIINIRHDLNNRLQWEISKMISLAMEAKSRKPFFCCAEKRIRLRESWWSLTNRNLAFFVGSLRETVDMVRQKKCGRSELIQRLQVGACELRPNAPSQTNFVVSRLLIVPNSELLLDLIFETNDCGLCMPIESCVGVRWEICLRWDHLTQWTFKRHNFRHEKVSDMMTQNHFGGGKGPPCRIFLWVVWPCSSYLGGTLSTGLYTGKKFRNIGHVKASEWQEKCKFYDFSKIESKLRYKFQVRYL